MTVENDFLPFATGSSANVLTQSAYAQLAAVTNGYQAGVAQSAALNKTWRQSSIMAAVIAQFIVAETGQPAVDDGTTATLLANFTQAVVLAAKQRVILTDTGAANAHAASNAVPMAALPVVSGVVQTVQIAHTNTGAATYAPDGLASNPIISLAGLALQGNELPANGIATLVSYVGPLLNSGNLCWVLYECIGGAQQVPTATGSQHAVPFGQVQSGVNYAAAAGTSDALTATLASGLPALPDGFPLTIKAASANATTTPTLNLTLGTTATGAKTVVKGAGAALAAGDIAGANHELQLTYNAVLGNWVLNNPATGVNVVKVQQATATVAGIAQLATQAQVIAGTDNTTIVTPATLAGSIANMINNSGASSDIALQVGQVAYIDVAAATTVPLHIATGDLQLYEIQLELNPGGTSAVLLPNNSSYTNMLTNHGMVSSTSTVGVFNAYQSGFSLGYNDSVNSYARVSTRTANKTALATSYSGGNSAVMGGGWYTAASGSTIDTTTVWSSLGTLTFGAAATGRIIIRRIA